ncbi:dihydrolipoyllysine-residue acetyltransferase [Venatoribacter cucullus]|uniref:Acetyltransferase component of pyruvate dehydrogenase complex n=1 Tax=Venatoribacter cucullus TaxID=2661630 RepID=A0A9X7UWV3_9GAMM|nr:dihydrolipoyllysine-residue acetyltransferase [Venatoribacter cucullus]QQD23511.1 dihydrolipoyllysine-residue acetyltransferase [Venatoribacter cucullus]
MTTLKIPDLGGSSQVEVIELMVQAGEQVSADQGVLVLETDKATMEIPAEQAGVITKLLVKVGDKVSTGDAFAELDASAAAAKPAEEKPAEEKPAEEKPAAAPAGKTAAETTPVTTPAAPATAQPVSSASAPAAADMASASSDDSVHAGPAVRKLARELGADLAQIKGSGNRGRIQKEDVHAFVKQRMQSGAASGGSGVPAVPEVDFSQFGPVHTQPLNNVKRATARAMTIANLNVPQVTQFDQADITDLEAYRVQQNARYAKQGIKFSLVPFVLKALAHCLREFPTFNASLNRNGEELILKDYVHIGVAVDTPKGLLVPVLRDVDKKTVTEITQELQEKAVLAREGKLPLAQMQGGCCSLSSLGGIGGTAFTPIVNPPEVAILGLSKATMQPVWDGQSFVPRLMLPLSLSYDHRVIDGAEAARFSQRLVACLQDLREIIM